jgi:N-acyl-D-aspartate/D-glutamate deacylase
MPIDTLRAGIKWSWDDFPGYLGALARQGVGPNVAAFIGHSAIRYAVMGRAAVERAATAEEIAGMVALVRDGIAAGAIGWSTSLSPTHFFGDGTPAPSRLAEPEELLALAAALRDLDRGVMEIAPRSTVGGPDDKREEQQFFAEMARASRKLVSWAPLLDNPFAPGSAQQILADAVELQAQGVQVVPQVGCRALEVRFDFAEPAFFLQQNPIWREFMAKPRDERRRLFADPAFRRQLDSYGSFVAMLAHGWERLILRMPASDATRRWQDRSVADIAAATRKPSVDAFCDTVLADDLAGQWGVCVMNYDEAGVAELIRSPAALVALSDAGAHVDTLCDQGFTTSLLGDWVRVRGKLSLEEAVQLITSVPAERYGLVGRGRLAPGYAADAVLFDPARVATRKTQMVHDLPGGQRRLLQEAEGIVAVWVNGEAVVEDGRPTDRRPGRVLRGGA